jgi:opacity protein-like surface antigen
MRATLRALAVVPALLAGVMVGGAEAQGLRLEVSGLYATLSGDDFDETDSGIGFEGAIAFALNSKWSLAAGISRTSHGVDGLDENLTALQFFAEPRFMLGASGAMTPYLFGRVGYTSASLEFLGVDTKQTGFGFGGGAGLMYDLSGSLKLNVSAAFQKISLGDVEADGETIEDTDSSGSSLYVRAGLSIGFGGSSALRTSPRR